MPFKTYRTRIYAHGDKHVVGSRRHSQANKNEVVHGDRHGAGSRRHPLVRKNEMGTTKGKCLKGLTVPETCLSIYGIPGIYALHNALDVPQTS